MKKHYFSRKHLIYISWRKKQYPDLPFSVVMPNKGLDYVGRRQLDAVKYFLSASMLTLQSQL